MLSVIYVKCFKKKYSCTHFLRKIENLCHFQFVERVDMALYIGLTHGELRVLQKGGGGSHFVRAKPEPGVTGVSVGIHR